MNENFTIKTMVTNKRFYVCPECYVERLRIESLLHQVSGSVGGFENGGELNAKEHNFEDNFNVFDKSPELKDRNVWED